MSNIIDIENAYTSGVYGKRPVAIVRGQGARVWDDEGLEYIDCTAGYGVANIGHARPEIAEAIAAPPGPVSVTTRYADRRSPRCSLAPVLPISSDDAAGKFVKNAVGRTIWRTTGAADMRSCRMVQAPSKR